jgi:hypothetical protein
MKRVKRVETGVERVEKVVGRVVGRLVARVTERRT